MLPKPTLLLVLGLTLSGLSAQQKSDGPLIVGYGAAWDIPAPGYATDTTMTFRAVFDIMNSPEDKSSRNPWMETAARFLNMHSRAGIPAAQLKVALVVHNQASPDLLTDPYYEELYGQSNPNRPMLEALLEAGAQIIFCGQSSYSRNIPIEHTVPGVKLGLSAMTALIQLQDQGYRLVKF